MAVSLVATGGLTPHDPDVDAALAVALAADLDAATRHALWRALRKRSILQGAVLLADCASRVAVG